MSIVFLSQSSGPTRTAAEQAGEDKPREHLEAVSEQFEALFLQQILKQMRQSGDALRSDSGVRRQERDTFYALHDQVLAESLASQRQLGIADMLVEQLSGPGTASSDNGLKDSDDPVVLSNQEHGIPNVHVSAAFAQPIPIERKDSDS